MLAASQIAFLPVDLGRWDRCLGGDALVVPLWTDVRPLRGAAGLLDWRLNGRLSQLLREGRVEGATGEKLLFVTSRVPWRRVLTVGVGATTSFSEDAFRASLGAVLDAFRGLGIQSVGLAPPGRDMDRITPERALRVLLSVAEQREEQYPGTGLNALTIIDVPPAIKAMAETVRAIERSLTR
jgi:leucyl aminopeptidase